MAGASLRLRWNIYTITQGKKKGQHQTTNIFPRSPVTNRLQTMPQKPYKPPYAHLFQTIYVCRQDLSNNQTSLKKTESAVLISLPLFYHIFDQKQHNFDQFFQKI